ncbi:hypothetical protein LUU34_00276900 [Aix galericulata]|nr:hypothetical protein LUU34_00276900 [Aix galericulata]
MRGVQEAEAAVTRQRAPPGSGAWPPPALSRLSRLVERGGACRKRPPVADTSPILTEKEAKQILRTRREDRQRKAGFPDEPMRVSSWSLKRIHITIVLRTRPSLP